MPRIKAIILPFLLCLFTRGCHSDSDDGHIYCAYAEIHGSSQTAHGQTSGVGTDNNGLKTNNPHDPGGTIINNNTIKCHEKDDFCYSLWNWSADNHTQIIVKQGCWDKPIDICSGSPGLCITKPYKDTNSNFCCCSGNLCNMNVTMGEAQAYNVSTQTSLSPGPRFMADPNYRERTIVIALSSVISVAVVIIVAYLVYRLYLGRQKEPMDPLDLEEASPPSPDYELDQLKLCNLIERGRYGEVWKGLLNEHDVAVKIFTLSQRRYYINEKEIYTLPFMDHPSLCKYYGGEERIGLEGNGQYLLVLSYVESGTLTSHLKNNTISWSTLCRMSQSITNGLAHLHTDVHQGGKFKPAIAHRDFNTRNIMVQPDMSCVICDMGFAMKIARNVYQDEGEMTSLTDVGTLRYMAPEVLDGAVNLRDCEASLKQIDVYSLGLVLWEIASRCNELYQGMPVPDYQLPFQAEGGVHPSFEEMQLLVSRNKTRPAFPDVWKDTNQAMRALKETIEDCWDQDAEARLTALCVEERLLEMATLWDARHKGVTPTVNVTAEFGGGDKDGAAPYQAVPTSSRYHQQIPNSQSLTYTTDLSSTGDDDDDNHRIDRNGNVPTLGVTPGGDSYMPHNPRLSQSVPEHSVSTSNTETTITSPSESEPTHHHSAKSNCNLNYAKTHKVLQPHHGQNPIVERNTHKRSDEELAIVGNTLVEKSAVTAKPEPENNRASTTGNNTYNEDIFDNMADNLETSLVQNDILSHQRNAPIPYVQNQVHPNENTSVVVRPKQPNVPGNGASHNVNKQHKGKHGKGKKSRDKYSVLQSLFHWNPLSKSHQNSEQIEGERRSSGGGPTPPVSVFTPLLNTSHQRSHSDGGNMPAGKSNLEPRSPPVGTEVYLMNGAPVVRPTHLPVSGHSSSSSPPRPGHSNTQPHSHNRLGIAEVGVAKLQSACNGRPAMVKMRTKSHSNVDLSPTFTKNETDSDNIDGSLARRANSLVINSQKLNGHNTSNLSPNSIATSDNNQNIVTTINNTDTNKHNNEDATKDGCHSTNNVHPDWHTKHNNQAKQKKRVKTPLQMKNNRMSLYDDRMMTQSCDDITRSNQSGDDLSKSSISLQQFGSVNVDLDLLRAADFQC